MSSINLKIDKERDVIQSYYNGKWNDLSNRVIDTRLYPIVFPSEKGMTPEAFAEKYKDAEGNFKQGDWANSGQISYPVNPTNGIVFKGTTDNAYDIIIPTDIMRAFTKMPSGYYASVPYSRTPQLFYIDEPVVKLISVLGNLHGGKQFNSNFITITLPSNGQTLFPNYDPNGYVTIIHIEPIQ